MNKNDAVKCQAIEDELERQLIDSINLKNRHPKCVPNSCFKDHRLSCKFNFPIHMWILRLLFNINGRETLEHWYKCHEKWSISQFLFQICIINIEFKQWYSACIWSNKTQRIYN